MTILVTGSEGFIGGEMMKYLQDKGEDTIGYDTKVDDFDVIDFSDISYVMHFGAISSTTEKDISKIIKYNYEFTTNLIEICHCENIPIQISSSASVYGQSMKRFMHEDDELDIKSLYALSKYLCEKDALRMINNYGCDIQILRYFNVFSYYSECKKGEQASPHYKFQSKSFFKEPLILFEGSDKIYRDFIHVDDLIEIQYKLSNIKADGIFNIGSGKATSFEEVAKSFNADIEYIPFPEHLKEHYQYYTCADMTKTNETLKNEKYGTNNRVF